jgi:hypothetical protein
VVLLDERDELVDLRLFAGAEDDVAGAVVGDAIVGYAFEVEGVEAAVDLVERVFGVDDEDVALRGVAAEARVTFGDGAAEVAGED